MEKFKQLGLSFASLKAIEKKGFEEPTEIQAKTIPVLLNSNKDIIAQAQTGTGKTAAFGLVFVEKLEVGKKAPQALVLAPTRELAVQVAEEINSLKGDKKLVVAPIYGGQSISFQVNQLKRGVDIVVGTPGRILDHLNKKKLDLSQIDYLVLDEADEMLNMGFIEDLEKIMKYSNSQRQTLLFSATMPKRIVSLAEKYMKKYQLIETEKKQLTTAQVDQIYYEVYQRDKFEALCRIIDYEKEFYGIIFCRTKVDVDHACKHLNDRGYSADALHGDIAQSQRERILKNFKAKKTMLLIATDVAARGIDINNLTHVINYALPQDPESYIHRIGRTGRAGKVGTAITFITPDEFRRLSFIKRITNVNIRKEKVPSIQKIIEIKRGRLLEELSKIMQSDDLASYHKLAEELFKGEDDKDQAIAALLKFTLAREFDLSSYSNIQEVQVKPQQYNNYNRGRKPFRSGGPGGNRGYKGNRGSRGSDSGNRSRYEK
jgi:ATP-dependent RNA helicase DeaD